MHDAHEFLTSLTVVLAVAALMTVVFQRIHLPVVLGYVIAGLIVGPHVSIPLVADPSIVQTLSELGVILLMFSLGLEFSLGKLATVGPTAAVTAVIQSAIMAWLGFVTGRLFGWTTMESVFLGAVIAISSTTIIAKVFDEQRVGGRLRELVVGILLIEDLIAIIFMAGLTAVASGAGLSMGALFSTLGRLAAFLTAILGFGMLIVPRSVRYVTKLGRAETTLVASIGICFLMAYLAQAAGYSVALGAFIAGSLVSESGQGTEVEHLIQPVRDMFAAIFFVSVGMLIDPALLPEHWLAITVITAVVLFGKIGGVALGAFLTGSGTRTAVQAGMSLAQIGEFSFIIAGLGLTLGATREFLYPVAVAVSAITTLTTPLLIGASGHVAELVDRKLPRPLQTFAALHAAWLERLGTTSAAPRTRRRRRAVRLLILDTAVLIALIIGASAGLTPASTALTRATGLDTGPARTVVIVAALVLSIPLIVAIGRLSLQLGRLLARAALPAAGKVDLDAAPRRILALTIELSVLLPVGVVVLAASQPFLPGFAGPVLLGSLFLGFGVAIWRSATNLEGHVHAGSLAVVDALAKYARASESEGGGVLAEVQRLMPGLGALSALRLGDDDRGSGRSLSELNLRGQTGATVLAILREGKPIVAPSGAQRLRGGDLLALAGTQGAIEEARKILLTDRADPPSA